MEEPADASEVQQAWVNRALPDELAAFWGACRDARLFEDVEYGQWGLHVLSPEASAARTASERAERPSDFMPDDIVLGEFLGDQELLVLAPSGLGRRRLLVALPLDPRADWFGAAESLGEFLNLYFDSLGAKYWERGEQPI